MDEKDLIDADGLLDLDGASEWSPRTLADRARACHRAAADARGRGALLQALCDVLGDPARRALGLQLLHHLRLTPANEADSPLRVERFALKTSTFDEHVDLLLLPSIFQPEDWSYTFLEGLLRRPNDSYEGAELVELGTGSGWVAIALLRATGLSSVVAVDINPIAEKVARINAILNSYDDAGRPLYDAGRKLLFERFQVRRSDLLKTVLESGQRFDFVVGCIPQVLSPSPDFDPEHALEELDEARLYDLSNYFVLQGVYEDQFGLGLTARGLEQSVHVLKPGGRVILNIAGRPGSGVIERMFARRGYAAQEIWARRVEQAADTDIAELAKLEQRAHNPFEFYVSLHSREPIGARTAEALRQAGRPIWHDVKVMEATLLFERELAPFYRATRALNYETLMQHLDLSAISHEQVQFLRSLAERFGQAKTAPYTEETGSSGLRGSLSNYLARHFELYTTRRELFVAPDRQTLMQGLLLALCEPSDRILLSAGVEAAYRAAIEEAGLEAIVANDDLEDLSILAEALEPRVIIAALSRADRSDASRLVRLCSEAQARQRVVLVDASEGFEITSKLHQNALLESVARMPLADRPLVIVGLLHNRVYPGLRPAFVFPVGPRLGQALVAFAESTYSRVNTFTERYYEGLFEDVLAFQLQRGPTRQASLPAPRAMQEPRLAGRLERVLQMPAFGIGADRGLSPSVTSARVLRLDYGENELELPDRLAQGILLGFTNLGGDASHQRVAELVAAFYQCHEQSSLTAEQVAVGAGVFPLLFDAARVLRARLGRPPRIAIADGHYGYLPPVFALAGCEIQWARANAEQGFELTPRALADLERVPDILLVVNPNNPTGTYYRAETLEALGRFADEHGCWLFSDEIFADLDLADPNTDATPVSPAIGLNQVLGQLAASPAVRQRLVRFGGFSKMFAAGGLRVGWALCADTRFVKELCRCRLTPLERHSRVASEVMLRQFGGSSSEQATALASVRAYLRDARQTLRQRRQWLVAELGQSGARLPPGRPAGLFVFPDVSAWYGREIELPEGGRQRLLADNLVATLEEHFGVRVNSGEWARAPGHIRLCFSLSDRHNTLMRRRLGDFFERLSRAEVNH